MAVTTIRDVARLAGVGLGTASRVVSGNGSVSPDTREKVLWAIQQLDFRPSHAARALTTGVTQMIGVYIPILKGSFYTPVLRLIDTELRVAGRHMVVAFGVGQGDASQQAKEGVDFLIERGCDGTLVFGNALPEHDIAELMLRQSRLVVLNHAYSGMEEHCFCIDHTQGGRLAARELLDHGHRQMAVIAGPSSAPDNVQRVSGFIEELQRDGIDTADLWVAESDFSPEGGWAAAALLLASGRKVSAVFCANDEMAMGAMAHFQQHGLAVPGDVSVIGYDDTAGGAFLVPPLTTVHIPWSEVTRNGLYALLERCYGTPRPVPDPLLLGVTRRASVARLASRRRRG
jgi:LacI family transcriptional regulator